MRRRKPDLMVVLAVLIGMGVIITGWVQGAMSDSPPPTRAEANR